MSRIANSILLVAIAASTGCHHTQLQKNTASQAGTLEDYYQQQVLDNLAMFVVDPNSLPSFALPKDGTSRLDDSATGKLDFGWPREMGRYPFSGLSTETTLDRTASGSWGITPVTDPAKLERMRCAYQFVTDHLNLAVPTQCKPTDEILKSFHGDKWSQFYPGYPVDYDCLIGPECWLGVGQKHEIPRDCCTYVGSHCGVYVWVRPGCREYLAQLTLQIMDYAFNDPKPGPTRVAVFHLDAQGLPVPEEESVVTLEETIPATKDVRTLWFGARDIRVIEELRKKGVDVVGLSRQTRHLFGRSIQSFEFEGLTFERKQDILATLGSDPALRAQGEAVLKEIEGALRFLKEINIIEPEFPKGFTPSEGRARLTQPAPEMVFPYGTPLDFQRQIDRTERRR